MRENSSDRAVKKIGELESAVEVMNAELMMIGKEEERARANLDSQRKQFFDEDRLNKDAHFGAAVKDHLEKRETAAAIDEGNYLSAEPVRCSTGFLETTYLELRMGEAKKVSEEVCLQIKEAAVGSNKDTVTIETDLTVLETAVGHEILRAFAVDTMGGLQSQWARTYLAKSENSFRATSLRRTKLPNTIATRLILLIATINVVFIAIGIAEFYMSTYVWEIWWALATLVYIILDIFVFQTTAILVTNFVIPSLAREQVMLNMNIVFPILCRLWKSTLGAQDTAHQPAGLSAPASMYISRKIAETYPLVFESCADARLQHSLVLSHARR